MSEQVVKVEQVWRFADNHTWKVLAVGTRTACVEREDTGDVNEAYSLHSFSRHRSYWKLITDVPDAPSEVKAEAKPAPKCDPYPWKVGDRFRGRSGEVELVAWGFTGNRQYKSDPNCFTGRATWHDQTFPLGHHMITDRVNRGSYAHVSGPTFRAPKPKAAKVCNCASQITGNPVHGDWCNMK